MQVKKQQLEPDKEQGTGSELGKEHIKGLFNLHAELEAQAGIKIAWRNINNLRYTDDTTLMADSEEELRASWGKWKRRVKKLA